jgi:chromate transporter
MNELLLTFAQLFGTFFVIGLFTFGGGYAMLSLIQGEVVVKHAWISESAFTDIVAISQATPGPIGINCATYVGYDVTAGMTGSHLVGILGSATATLALVLPSFLLVLALAKIYQKVHHHPLFLGVMEGLRPAVVGLIGAAALVLVFQVNWDGLHPQFTLLRDNFPDWKSWVLLGAALVASFRFKAHPILLIVAGGVAGLLLY